ncbi:septation protein SepH [Mycobacteroides franklinii]|uniref:septation protein SepH n=1 Tax=Mycobacteroides franklinii TaxID=948102 RepID=UPI000994191F|nr:septation protein SepH [Mycobacteroides franklinii]
MRELKVIGLSADGKRVICQDANGTDRFAIDADDKLRAAARGDLSRLGQIQIEMESSLRPREIQARIRAGATVQQVAAAAGADVSRIERFAHPVLLERQRAAEMASAAHPVRNDGPAVSTLADTVAGAMFGRGLDPDAIEWDAWKVEDGRWTVQLQWRAGRSDNKAHFRFTPGAHGGTVTALDDSARELIDPTFTRSLRPVAAVAPLLPEPAPELFIERPAPLPEPEQVVVEENADNPPAPAPRRTRRNKPAVPTWEDVLLGVRSSGQN